MKHRASLVTIRCVHPGCPVQASGTSLGVARFNAYDKAFGLGMVHIGPHSYCTDHAPQVAKCPHGSGRSDQCSQCMGAVAKVVTLTDDGVLHVDGDVLTTQLDRSRAAAKQATVSYGRIKTGRRTRGTREVE